VVNNRVWEPEIIALSIRFRGRRLTNVSYRVCMLIRWHLV
jgi:hypothetical protein